MKINNIRKTLFLLALCIYLVQFGCILLTYGEENTQTDAPSTCNSEPSTSQVNYSQPTDTSLRGERRTQGILEPIESTIKELPSDSTYNNKSLTELLHDVALIMKELNQIYLKQNNVDIQPYIDRLNEIRPYLDKKAETNSHLYLSLLINLDRRLRTWTLQDIFTRPYINFNYKTTKEDVQNMVEQINERYPGYYTIPYSSIKPGRPISLYLRSFPTVEITEAHLNAANASKNCSRIDCGEYAYCYMINDIPQCKCLNGFIPGSKGPSLQFVCKKLIPISCRIRNGGCSENADCLAYDEDIVCECKEGYIGDGIKCTNKYSNGLIRHLELSRTSSSNA